MQPFLLSRQVQEEYHRYINTSFPLADPDLAAKFQKKIKEENLLWRGPFITLARKFKPGSTIQSLVKEGILDPRLARIFKFPSIFAHQEQATRRLTQGKHTIIATGTGSGKTEAFLIPIVDYCLRNKAKKGTKAILLYPMNALANDQLNRLRSILSEKGVTFARYTGDTERDEDSRPEGIPKEEVWSRAEIRRNPPDILITNYSMLEYLLVRNEDQIIFRHRQLRFLVLDEVHTYRGALGTEIACLIRRLKEHTGLAKGRLICVGTSATVQSAEDAVNQQEAKEDALRSVAKFASDLFAEPFGVDSIIEEEYDELKPLENPYCPPLPNITMKDLQAFDPDRPETALKLAEKLTGRKAPPGDSPGERLGQLLSQNKIVRWLENFLTTPLEMETLIKRVRGMPERSGADPQALAKELTGYLLVGTSALENGEPRLKPKLHLFFRGLWNFSRCLNPDCGELLEGGDDVCPYCKSKTLPLEVCRSCGQDFLKTRIEEPLKEKFFSDKSAGYIELLPNRDKESDEFTLHLTPKLHLNTEDDDTDTVKLFTLWVCPACGCASPHKGAGTCYAPHCEGKLYPYQVMLNKATKCPACQGRYGTKEVVTMLSTGTASSISTLTTSLMSNLKEEREKRLLIFSDNRQDTAYQAGYLKDKHEQFTWRQLIYHIVSRREREGKTPISLRYLPQEVFNLAVQYGVKKRPPTGYDRDREIGALTWDVLAEFTRPGQRRVNLEGLGLIAVRYAYLEELQHDPHFLEIQKRWNFTTGELLALLAVIMNEMRYRRALDHPLYLYYLDSRDKELKQLGIKISTYDRYPVGFGYGAVTSGKPYKIRALINKGGAPSVFQQYFRRVTGKKNVDELIEECVHLLQDFGYIQKRKIGKKNGKTDFALMVDHTRLEVVPFSKGWQCSSCRRVYTENVRDKCPTYNCQGTLQPFKPDPNNYYVHYYTQRFPQRIVPVEHSGQIPGETRAEYEEQFVKGEVNVMVCTPTMELGVDIGQLVTLIMRNIPPSPSNYAQRAGRAGREHRIALINVYAQGSPHDAYFYQNPEQMIRGAIRPPSFKLDNERIIRRHIHSLILEKLNSELPGTLGSLVDENLRLTGMDHIFTELQERKNEIITAILNAFEKDTTAGGVKWLTRLYIEKVIEEFPQRLREALHPWLTRLHRVVEQLEAFPRYGLKPDQEKRRQHLDAVYRRMTIDRQKAYPLSYLSEQGFLPGYAFPGEQVLLEAWMERRDPLVRDKEIGLEEYAPGNLVYVQGMKLRVYGINFQRTGSIEQTGGGLEQFYYACPNCDYVSFSESTVYCEHCDAEMEKYRYLEATSFNAERVGSITSEEEARLKEGYQINRFYCGSEGETYEFPYPGLPMTYQRRGQLFFVNTGFRNKQKPTGNKKAQELPDFAICKSCGRWLDPLKKSWESYHRKSLKCDGEVASYHLGMSLNTDVLLIDVRPPDDAEKDAYMATLRNALLAGASLLLETEPGEIGGFDRKIITNEGPHYQIVLYDAVPGGAGYLWRLATQFPEAAQKAYELINQCGCIESCYCCLRNYYNQREHQIMDKGLVRDLLGRLAEARPLKGNMRDSRVHYPEGQENLNQEDLREGEETESPIEDALLEAIRLFDLPEPEKQYKVYDADGTLITRADFAYPHRQLLIYCDGEEYHNNQEQWERDMEQQNYLMALGWRVLRFGGRQILQNREKCVNQIKRLLD